jgi:hypothetical protein
MWHHENVAGRGDIVQSFEGGGCRAAPIYFYHAYFLLELPIHFLAVTVIEPAAFHLTTR